MPSVHKMCLLIVYLSSMRDSKIINHQNVSLLPAIEDHVLVDFLAHMLHVPHRNLRTITKTCMHRHILGPCEIKYKKLYNNYQCLGNIVASSPRLFFSLNVTKETKKTDGLRLFFMLLSFHCITYAKNLGMWMRLEA